MLDCYNIFSDKNDLENAENMLLKFYSAKINFNKIMPVVCDESVVDSGPGSAGYMS